MAGPTKYRPTFNRRRRDPIGLETPPAPCLIQCIALGTPDTDAVLVFNCPCLSGDAGDIQNQSNGGEIASILSGIGTDRVTVRFTTTVALENLILAALVSQPRWTFGPNRPPLTSNVYVTE